MPATRLPIRRLEARGRHFRLDRAPNPAEAPKIAAKLRVAWGLSSQEKLDLDRVCERLGAEVSTIHLDVPRGGAQGFLIPRTDGFLIEVDPEPSGGWGSVRAALRLDLSRHRRRFLIAHEIAHTLFYRSGPDGPRRAVAASAAEEDFCDALARALLVPQVAAASLPFDPDSALHLQRRFDVSLELSLRSLASAHPDDRAAWLLLHRDGEILVQWASGSHQLPAVRELAKQAWSGNTNLDHGSDGSANALCLRERGQVIVTWVPRVHRRAA